MATVISDKIIKLMNYRIKQEEESSRLYLSMSVWLDNQGYEGAAKLWKRYSEEERVHMNWAYQYLLDLNVKPEVPELEKPQDKFKGLPQIIAMSLKHEMDITSQCKQLAIEAQAENDHMTVELAHRYLKEQVEELAKTQLWIDKLILFGDDKIALRLLDTEMGEKA